MRSSNYWSNKDRVIVAEVPELPGCLAHASSQEEALAHAQMAIRLWIDTAREFGDPIPQLFLESQTHA